MKSTPRLPTRTLVIIVVLLVTVAARVSVDSQHPAPHGAESPQAVVATLERAVASGDRTREFAMLAPAFRESFAHDLVEGVVMALSFSNPDEWPVTPGPVELAAKQQGYRDAVGMAVLVLEPHGLASFIGRPPRHPEVAAALSAVISRADTVELLAALVPALDRIAGALGFDEPPPTAFTIGITPVTDYAIDGETATARAGDELLRFTRVDGRWYLAPPE